MDFHVAVTRRICYFRYESDRKNYNLLFTISDFKWNLILSVKWDPNKNENEFIYNLQFTRCRRHPFSWLSSALNCWIWRGEKRRQTMEQLTHVRRTFRSPKVEGKMTTFIREAEHFTKFRLYLSRTGREISSSAHDIDRIPIPTVPGVTRPTLNNFSEWVKW